MPQRGMVVENVPLQPFRVTDCGGFLLPERVSLVIKMYMTELAQNGVGEFLIGLEPEQARSDFMQHGRCLLEGSLPLLGREAGGGELVERASDAGDLGIALQLKWVGGRRRHQQLPSLRHGHLRDCLAPWSALGAVGAAGALQHRMSLMRALHIWLRALDAKTNVLRRHRHMYMHMRMYK